MLKTLIAATLLLAPAADATWRAYGSHEPDSEYDNQGYMWFTPPGAHTNRVYFAAHTIEANAATNLNIGLLNTRFETLGTEYHEAILGVWTDCNGDGYVGLAETGAREYRSELLLDRHLCPHVTSGPWNRAHHYRNWVTELIPIGPHYYSHDGRVIYENRSTVWGDHGAPTGEGRRPSCTLERLPQGGARTTGAILDHADCYLALLAGDRSARAYNGALGALGDPNSLAIDGTHWAHGGHPLQHQTFGDAESSNSIAKVHDCSGIIFLTDDSPPGDDLDMLYIYPPGIPSIRIEGWTAAGTIMYAAEYLHNARWSPEHDYDDHCYPQGDTDDNEEFYGLVEGRAVDVDERRKTAADFRFYFHEQARGAGLAALPVAGGGGRSGTPPDLGVDAAGSACTLLVESPAQRCAPTGWYSDSTRVRAVPTLLRSNLAEPSADFPDPYVLTFYAFFSPTLLGEKHLEAPFAASGKYGFEACGANTYGVHNGWDCSPDAWFAGTPCSSADMGQAGWCGAFPVVGRSFSLRDVDCYDGAIRYGEYDVGIGAAYYGGRWCGRAP